MTVFAHNFRPLRAVPNVDAVAHTSTPAGHADDPGQTAQASSPPESGSTRTRGRPSTTTNVSGPVSLAATNGAEPSTPAEGSAPTTFADRVAACGERFKRPLVALAVDNGEPPDMPLRDVDEQLVAAGTAGNTDRVRLLARHRNVTVLRAQRDAFPPDDPDPIAA